MNNLCCYDKGHREFLAVVTVVLITIFLLGIAGSDGRQQGQPVRREGVGQGNCAVCHAERQVLPGGHEDTLKMTMADCTSCHTPTERNLHGRIPLGHIHCLYGAGCGDCHKAANPVQLSTGDCLACHESFEAVAGRTRAHTPNPHNSPHYGNSVDCDLCHRIHGPSENFCGQCHAWSLIVP